MAIDTAEFVLFEGLQEEPPSNVHALSAQIGKTLFEVLAQEPLPLSNANDDPWTPTSDTTAGSKHTSTRYLTGQEGEIDYDDDYIDVETQDDDYEFDS